MLFRYPVVSDLGSDPGQMKHSEASDLDPHSLLRLFFLSFQILRVTTVHLNMRTCSNSCNESCSPKSCLNNGLCSIQIREVISSS